MPDITELQVFEALGVDGNEQDTAEPTEKASQEPAASDTGAKEREFAEPAKTDAEDGGDGDESAGEQPDVDGGDEPLPDSINEIAAQHRRREQNAAIEQAVEKAVLAERERVDREMESFFKTAKLKNTITNTPITNMEEFKEWRQSFENSRLQAELKAGKLTPETLDKAISENPLMKRAEEIIKKSEEERKQQEMTLAQSRTEHELAEIRKLDPAIKNFDDLLKMSTAKEFYEYVKKGNSFLDAFYLANRERLSSQTAASAKQAAISNARSKNHLTATTPRGTGAASVPSDEMELFRALNPRASEADIAAYYNKIKS